jgi:hypothetical protein
MNFPEALTVTVLDTLTGSPVSDAAFVLHLRAQRKNDYDVGPVITGVFGRFSNTRSDCEDSIQSLQKMVVMDYSGDLSSCAAAAELRLHSPEALRRMIQNYDDMPEFWGVGIKRPEELFPRLKAVRNQDFEPVVVLVNETDIIRNPNIQVHLTRTDHTTPEARS